MGIRDPRLAVLIAMLVVPDVASAGRQGELHEQSEQLAGKPLPAGTLPIRVAAAPFASGDSNASVAVVVEIPADLLKETANAGREAARMRLSVVFYDRGGGSVADTDSTLGLSDEDDDTRVLRSLSWITVPPGAYRLWAGAVHTSSGATGSATIDIEVPDFLEPRLALSGITVATGAAPVARRHFAKDNDLYVYGEIYDRRAVQGPTRATVTIASNKGDVVYRAPFEPISATPGHHAYVPLKQLEAGAYVATVEVVSIAPLRAAARRTFAFEISPH